MKLKTLDDAVQILTHNKRDEREIDVPSNSFDIKYRIEDGDVVPFLSRKKDGSSLKIIEPAFNQFLETVCGSGAKSVWNYAANSANIILEEQMKDAREMLQMKADRTRKTVRLHALDEGRDIKVMGVTSTKYAKIYDLDLLNRMGTIMGSNKYMRGYHTDNVTTLDFLGGSFPAPDGLDFQMRIRIRNNQWGRSGLVIHPIIVRLVCSNGASVPVMGSKFSTRHVGDVNLAYMDTAVRQVSGKFDELKAVVHRSFEKKVNTTSILEKVKKIFHIGKKDMELVNGYLAIEKYPNTLYGVANAISRLANDKTEERRIELQAVAGRVYSGL